MNREIQKGETYLLYTILMMIPLDRIMTIAQVNI